MLTKARHGTTPERSYDALPHGVKFGHGHSAASDISSLPEHRFRPKELRSAAMDRHADPPDPAVVFDLLEAFRGSKAMFAAVRLGVFDALETSTKPAAALGSELGVNADALGRLLDACVALRLLQRVGDGYANTPVASAYLCRSSPHRMTGYLNYSDEVLWKLWGNLEDAIREGTHRWQQTFGWDGPIFAHFFRTEERRREFLLGMHGYGQVSSPRVAAAFDLGRYRQLVDLGGATGHLALAACQRYPQLRAVVFDLPGVIPLANEIIAASPVAGRVTARPGDFFTDPLPAADLYSMGRILHDWSEEKIHALLRKVFDHLPHGGGLLVAEKLIDDDRSGPLSAQLQSLNMLLVTEGKERTPSEYTALLREAGFAEVEFARTHSPLDAILATKGAHA
jgi:acetylserotonin N-methyltransferase